MESLTFHVQYERPPEELVRPMVYKHHHDSTFFGHSRRDDKGQDLPYCKTKLPAERCQCGEYEFERLPDYSQKQKVPNVDNR